jgi:hypothetical protein
MRANVLTLRSIEQINRGIPDFVAGNTDISLLGSAALVKAEELLVLPLSIPGTNKTGDDLGDLFGREKHFVDNTKNTEQTILSIAEATGQSRESIWSSLYQIFSQSGIDQPMHRKLYTPYGSSGVFWDDIRAEVSRGRKISLIMRENVANWAMRRHLGIVGVLGDPTLSGAIDEIIIGGGSREIKAEPEKDGVNAGLIIPSTETWHPEIWEIVKERNGGLLEHEMSSLIHVPALKKVLGHSGVEIKDVPVETRQGNEVMSAIQSSIGNRDNIILISGNAPAGYTEVEGGLVLARAGIDPDNIRMFSDGTRIVSANVFSRLSNAEKSRVQNLTTTPNSFNGWLSAIAAVNQYVSK